MDLNRRTSPGHWVYRKDVFLNVARNEIHGFPRKKHRSGRRRSSTERADCHMLQLCRNGRAKSTNVLRREWQQCLNVRVCRKTVNNPLISAGYRSQVPKWKLKLTQHHCEACLRWAEQHQRLQPGSHVVFTDESRFLLFRKDSHVRVQRQAHDAWNEDCVHPTVQAGGGGKTI